MVADASLKFAALVAAMASAATNVIVPAAGIPFFDVRLTTVGMAAAGSLIAFAYGTPVKSRKRLFGYAIGGVFIGVWIVQLAPAWFGWAWYSPALEPPLAGIIALLSRWIVPFFIEQTPSILRRITGQPQPPKDGDE